MNRFFLSILFATGLLVSCDDNSQSEFNFSSSGTGGSMARFTTVSGDLFTITPRGIERYDVGSDGSLELINVFQAGTAPETLFPFGGYLLVGAPEAMYIFNVADFAQPKLVSRYNHIEACDPVVAQGDYAYVTLRKGSTCRGNVEDRLEVIDISDLTTPELVEVYPTPSPYGLGIDGRWLFVCNGQSGLSVYDATQADDLKLIDRYTQWHAYDVIPHSGRLILTGQDGIFQYDYSDIDTLRLLSKIQVQ
jgi:hypothetical protein